MMHVIDKIFLQKKKNNLVKALGVVFLVALVLLLPSILKLVFPRTPSSPNWGRFICVYLLFLTQVAFFSLHPACRKMTKIGQYATGFLLLYLLGCLLSPWLTGCYRSSLELSKLFSASSLFFLFLYYSYKAPSFPILRVCAFIGCFLATGEAIIGLGQYALQSDLGLQWLGEKCLDLSGSVATVELIERIRWTGDASSASSLEVLRSYGTFDHPNHFGGFLVIGFLLTCHLLVHYAKARGVKNLLIAALSLQAMALATTFSRSAWLGGVLGVVILLGLRLAQCRGSWRKERILLVALGISACLMVFFFHGQIFQRCFPKYKSTETLAQSLQSLTEQNVGDRGRFQGIAQRMIIRYPWNGVGFREFVQQMPSFIDSSIPERLPVHNIYLLVAAEIGLPSAAAFIIFFILIGWQAFRKVKLEVLAALWIALALIGFMDNYLLTSYAGCLLLFSVAALVLIGYPEEKRLPDVIT